MCKSCFSFKSSNLISKAPPLSFRQLHVELCLQATSSWLVGQVAVREEWSTLTRISGARCVAKPGISTTHQWHAGSLTVEEPIRSPPRTSMVSAVGTPGSIRLNAVEWSQLWLSVYTDPSETKPATLQQLLVLSAQVREYKIYIHTYIHARTHAHTYLYHIQYNYFSFAGSLEVQLTNGKDECSGRVEVRHKEDWHTVCDQDWTLSKAQVVCENLQCGSAYEAPGRAHFGQGTGLVVEANDSCFNSTTTLQQCSREGFRSSSCGHDHDAGAICAGNVRINGKCC